MREEMIYLIDFGLSRTYKDKRKHRECREDEKIVGSYRYVSVNAHEGKSVSRRDDLISLMYVIVYLAKGKLPWQGIKAENDEELKEKIKERKKNIIKEELFEGLPDKWLTAYEDIINLKYDQNPLYSFYILLFSNFENINN